MRRRPDSRVPTPTRCRASTKLPVVLISLARRTPTAWGSRTVRPQPGWIPTRACVSAKLARSEATRKSQLSASSNPPVTATPLMAPMTGLETGRKGSHPRSSRVSPPRRRGPSPPSSLRSTPAQKAGSAPVRMMTSTDSSRSRLSMAVGRAPRRAAFNAFRTAGRLRVTVATRRDTSTSRISSTTPSLSLGRAGQFRGSRGQDLAGSAVAVLEGPTVGLRAGLHDPAEMLAEVAGGAEATARRHGLDGEVARLEEPLRQMDPLALKPLMGGGSGRGEKLAGEGPGAHGGSGGQIGDGEGLVQVLLHPGDGVGEEVGTVESRQRGVDVLRLAAVALGWDHELRGPAGWRSRCRSRSGRHEAEVDTGGAPRRRQDVALVDVQHAGIDRHVGIPAGELVTLCPMRGGPPALEQSRLGQDERAGAQAR